jgi:RNA polymerase sigma-70 factor (ECF subfamily)
MGACPGLVAVRCTPTIAARARAVYHCAVAKGTHAPVSDQFEGLDRLVAGDKAAWDRFVARFAPVIFAAVRRKLVPAGRADDAEDVAQDVFIRLCARDFRLVKRYDASRAKLSTWLTVIAHSAAIDHLRRQKAPAQTLDSVPEALLAVDPPKDPVNIHIPPDLLSPRQALVLEMLYQREMEAAEAAEILGVAPQTVRSTHHKALTKLRAHFRKGDI